jgi:hypothetical protein
VPPVVDKAAAPESLAAFGDTKTQTVGVLKKIKEILPAWACDGRRGEDAGLPGRRSGQGRQGRDDIAGFMEGYTQFFGGAQPNLPARAVMQVAALSNPGWLVEIEVVAAKK